MKLRDRLLWGVTCVVGAWLLAAFFAFSGDDTGLNKITRLGGKAVNKLWAGAVVPGVMESPDHYQGDVSNKAVKANDSGSIQQSVPKIPGQRIIPTTPEMRQLVEWLAAQMDQVPKKPARDKGNRLFQNSDNSENMTGDERPLWEQFHLQVRRHELYAAASDLTDKILKQLAESEIIDVVQVPEGTTLKLLFTLKDGARAVFKPMRNPRDKSDTKPDHFNFDDIDRHFSEVASFHLDRLLGFRRAPPTVGRKVNISSEIQAYAKKEFLKMFFWSPANRLCFFGTCTYYCSTAFAACGDPYMLEGSMSLFIPHAVTAGRRLYPWRRSYLHNRKASWLTEPNYCERVKKHYDPKDRRIWDFMDLSVLDFLIGNLDRHHYQQYADFGDDSSLLHFDQGKGFGKPYHDDLTCLQPIIHCCMIRRTTLVTLLKFYHGPASLAGQMKAAMADDLAAPILLDKHYNALDRRVPIILHEIAKCVKKKGLLNVVQDDGY